MNFNYFRFIFPLLIICTSGLEYNAPNKIWALLVAGSDGYFNYRHQADICHAYQILHKNGIPDENIIVMMVDDIANSTDNPTPGIIINTPGGEDVYKGVPKDYTGKHVNAKTFLNVLTGNKEAVKGTGTGRVIESGPNDYVFVNFVDHGGEGILCFPDDVLAADDLIKALKGMSEKSQFAKMIMYIEACYAGSMFDNLLDDDLNIFVTTAADPHESSYACYFDDVRETYLGDVFSVTWMDEIKHESLPTNDFHHQFEQVRTRVNTSHVEEYGDLDIGNTKLNEILGFKMKGSLLKSSGRQVKRVPVKDAHNSIHVPVEILKRKIQKHKNPFKRQQLQLRLQNLKKKRSTVDTIFNKIIKRVSQQENVKEEIKNAKYSLNKDIYPCYKSLMTTFSNKCFNIPRNPYVRLHLQKLVNMCAISSISKKRALNAIHESCIEKRYVNLNVQ